MSSGDLWVCAECGKTFETEEDWTEEDAYTEALTTLGVAAFENELVAVCDTCYVAAVAWARSKGMLPS